MKLKHLSQFLFISFILFPVHVPAFAQPLPGSYYDFTEATKDKPVTRNPHTLILYRPQNNGDLNDIHCWLRLENEQGEDVTYTACKAAYEWVNSSTVLPQKNSMDFSRVFNGRKINLVSYKKSYYLAGGMAMHMNLDPGKYKISVYTPKDRQYNFTYPVEGTRPFEWKSNIFEYDTDNPATVLFVIPTTNDNGFYNGGWYIDYKSPVFLKNRTVPKME